MNITNEEVINAQNAWGNAVVEVGRHVNDRGQSEVQTNKLLDTLYAFETDTVLFKPTKASLIPFRLTTEGARSYFIGSNDNFPKLSYFRQLRLRHSEKRKSQRLLEY